MSNNVKSIIQNIVKQAVAKGTPWFNYIVGRAEYVGISRELADEALHELVVAGYIAEHFDANKVAWYVLKPSASVFLAKSPVFNPIMDKELFMEAWCNDCWDYEADQHSEFYYS